MERSILDAFQKQATLYARAGELLTPHLRDAAALLARTLNNDGRILFCGNGGSAADAQHLAAELVVRLSAERERGALPGLALTTDSSILTAVSNDYGFEKIFSRQVEAHGRAGDLLFCMSTSGTSPNVLEALKMAGSLHMATILLTGRDNPDVAADLVIPVPADTVAAVQEMHIFCGHLLIRLTENVLVSAGK